MRFACVAGSLCSAALLVASVGQASAAQLRPGAHFEEHFDETYVQRWSPSEATKEQADGLSYAYVGKWVRDVPSVFPGTDKPALIASTKAAQHAISAPFDTPLDPAGKTFVVQYEVKLQKGLDCGGAYIKLLSESPDDIRAKEFSDKTPYTVMFGPDRCGSTNKVHFIVRHLNPVTGEYEEKHLMNPPPIKHTKLSSLYTLIIRPDQTYEILINDESAKTGSLLEDFNPPFNPPAEIDDENDTKPSDWVDDAKIADPEAVKPDDWDEDAPAQILDEEAVMPEGWLEDEEDMVPDPDAEKPEEWDDDEDGDFVPPMVPNPACESAPGCGPWTRPMKANPDYKGKWSAPLIDNPAYKGVWTPRKIANPNFFEDLTPANLSPIAGVGFEIWTMQEDILFDNVFVGTSEQAAKDLAKETFHVKYPIEQELEDKSRAAENKDNDKPASLKDNYVEFIRQNLKAFLDVAMVDPMLAFKTQPQTAAVLGGAIATLLGMLGVLLSLLSPKQTKPKKSSKPQAQQKSEAKTTSAKTTTTSEGVETRQRAAAKGKSAATDDE